jgi:periplasmic protein TonB
VPAAAESFSRVGFPPTATAAAGTPPRRLGGYLASLTIHAVIVLAIAWAPSTIRKPEPPLVRLVFHEPPPPPAVVAAPEPAPVVPTQAKRNVPARARKVAPKPVDAPVPAPIPEVVTAPTPAEPPPVASGVSGGVEGGVVGGVVGARGTEPVPVGAVARPPLLVRHVMPEYPPEARRRGVEGLVRLEAVLDLKGRVEDPIRIVASIPDLDAAAIAALRAWRFSPARNTQGEAVRVILEVPIRFVLR